MALDFSNTQFRFIPWWVKLASIGVAVACLAVAVYVVVGNIGKGGSSDVLLIALSVMQIALSAIILLIIYLFTENDLSVTRFKKAVSKILVKDIPDYIETIYLERVDADRSVRSVSNVGRNDKDFEVFYSFQVGSQSLRYYINDHVHNMSYSIWVRLSLFDLSVVLYVPLEQNKKLTLEDTEKIYAPVISTMETWGMNVSTKYGRQKFDNMKDYIDITFLKRFDRNIMFDGENKIQVVLMVGNILRNFVLDSQAGNVAFDALSEKN